MELSAHIRNRMINALNKIDKLSKEAQEIVNLEIELNKKLDKLRIKK
ncbi:MAG: hypothetical protein E6935_06520 [Clostridium butyricum]|nr:hypothetical protein [Clostridium butyricum]MDB2157727.1 hypothetical protein [Clostridium butyricum]MDU1337849.1 hypothetical protein [Clostridium butyricum]